VNTIIPFYWVVTLTYRSIARYKTSNNFHCISILHRIFTE